MRINIAALIGYASIIFLGIILVKLVWMLSEPVTGCLAFAEDGSQVPCDYWSSSDLNH